MSWKSFLPSLFGNEEEVSVDGPTAESEGAEHDTGNAAAAAELEEQPAEEEGGWWGNLTSSLGFGGDSTDPEAEAQALIDAGAPDSEKLDLLTELLTDEGLFSRVTSAETRAAALILESMTDAGKQQFIDAQGGALADQLLDNPGGDPWWADPLGHLFDGEESTSEDDRGFLEKAGDAWASHRSGNEALESLQAYQGGSLGGMTLDESGDHSLDVSGDLSNGTATVTLAELKVVDFEASSSDTTVKTGPGLAKGLSVTIDLPDQASGEATASASIQSLDWSELDIANPLMSVLVPRLSLMALQLSAMRSQMDPGTVAEARHTGAITDTLHSAAEWVEQNIAESLMYLGWELAPAIAELAHTITDADALADGLMSSSALTSLDYSLSLGALSLPAGATMTKHDPEDGDVAYEIGALAIESFSATLAQADRLSVLESEYQRLQRSDNLVDKQRVAALEVEMETVRGYVAEKLALDQKKQSEPLSRDEENRWIELDRELKTGVMHVEIGVIDLASVSTDGLEGSGMRIEGVSADLQGNDLSGPTDVSGARTDTDRLTALNADLDRRAGREAPEAEEGPDVLFAGIGDLGADVSVDSVTADSLVTDKGSAEDISATGISVHAGGDYAGVEVAQADAANIDSDYGTAGSASASGTEVVVRGNDVGGRVDAVSAETLAGMGAEAGSADAQGIVFDANADNASLRSISADSAGADDIRYVNGSSETTVASIDGTNLAARDVTSTGAGSATADAVSTGAVVHREDGEVIAQVSSVEAKDLSATDATTTGVGQVGVGQVDLGAGSGSFGGAEGSFDGVSLRDIGGKDLTTGGTGTMTVGSATAEGVEGGMAGVGSGAADQVGAEGIVVTRTEDALSATAERATVDGAWAEMDGVGGGEVREGSAEGLALTMDGDGTLATVEGAELQGIRGADGEWDASTSTVGEADRVSVGPSGVALDGENNLEGISVQDFEAAGIQVDLMHLPMDTVGESDSGAAEAFQASALASANGNFSSTIPLKKGGTFTVTAQVENGVIPLSGLDIGFKGSNLLGRLAGSFAASIEVAEGKGVQAKFLGIGLQSTILMDTREYAGLQSRKAGGGSKGSIHLQPLIEALMSGQVQADLDPEVLAELESDSGRARDRETRRDPLEEGQERATQDTIDETVQWMENDMGYGLEVDVGGIAINTSALSLGDGGMGSASGNATLDGSETQANRFTIEGTLGDSLTIGANKVDASALHTTLSDGTPIDASEVGVAGLDVTIDQPLARDRSIRVEVRGMTIESIDYGDTSRLREQG